MTQITYKGQDWNLREIKVAELDFVLVIAPYALYELLDVDDEYDNVIDEQITYYAEEEHFNLPAEELLRRLQSTLTFTEEI